MEQFDLTTDLACEAIDALSMVLTYPIGDNERFLKYRLARYSDAAINEKSPFHADRARHELDLILRFLTTYLRNPSGDNYYWLTNALIEFRMSQKAFAEEPVQNEQ